MKCVRQKFKVYVEIYLLIVRECTLTFKDLPNTVEIYIFLNLNRLFYDMFKNRLFFVSFRFLLKL